MAPIEPEALEALEWRVERRARYRDRDSPEHSGVDAEIDIFNQPYATRVHR